MSRQPPIFLLLGTILLANQAYQADRKVSAQCVSDAEHFDYAPHRTNVLAEFLAMARSGQLRAPDDEYDRIVRDLNLLESMHPILESVHPFFPYALDQLFVALDLDQSDEAFTELNVFYQIVAIRGFTILPGVKLLTFCDTLNIPVLAHEYELLSEVLYAHGNVLYGDGDRVSLVIGDDAYIYELSNGSGDCMSGCYCRQTWRFEVTSGGSISLLSYDPGPCNCELPNDGDFDGDGVMDCLDPCPGAEDDGETDADGDGVGDICDACALTIPAASVDAAGCPPPTPGDVDRDGDIALNDFVRLRNCLRGPGITACGYPEVRVYLDPDWDVDLRDFSIFQNCFSGANRPADASCAE